MKKLLFLLVFISTSAIAQKDQRNWQKVIEYESAGKVKSASSLVDKIYKKAVANGQEPEMIRCFFYHSKYLQVLEEDAQTKIINTLKTDINRVSIPSKAILNLVYAKCLNDYFNLNNYTIKSRTNTVSSNDQFLTWTENNFKDEINSALKKTIESEKVLKETPLKNYEAIFDYYSLEQFKSENLFDYLLQENIHFFTQKIQRWEIIKKNFTDLEKDLFANSVVFSKINFDFITDENLQKTLQLLQKRENYNPSLENQLERILFCKSYLLDNEETFLKTLNILRKQSKNILTTQKIQLVKANALSNQASKETHPDYYIQAIALLDSIISNNKDSNTYKLAIQKKQSITSKSLSIQLQKQSYSNENNRALIQYKNSNTIVLSFYKITQNQSELFRNSRFQKDSLTDVIIQNQKAITTKNYELLNKKDYFIYTTEVLLPQLQTGNYLVYFESDSDTVNKKAFAYETITISNLAVLASQKNGADSFQVLDRKTGKPINNVSIQLLNQTIKTDENGVATTTVEKNTNNNEQIVLTKDNDTLSIRKNYISYFREYTPNEDVKGKVEWYLDRAIYRPGQTVYYKGIAFQKKENATAVVANTSFKIILKDANNNTFKEFEVSTNEFGSFSGEFTLPKTGLTGNFSIQAKEPDDYEKDVAYNKAEDEHPFWDKVKFTYSEINFKVEEYKRPKFEVRFEPITKSYQVNQNVSLTAFAKSFAGSAISDAKVEYKVRINPYEYINGNYFPKNGSSGKMETTVTQTDASGKFTINFIAVPLENYKKENLPIFEYSIEATVTDINGETRSAQTTIKVGYHDLILQAAIPNLIETKNQNEIILSSTNLNGSFLATKGEVKLYYASPFANKFKNRVWPKPEINSISDEVFEQLFPYEYNGKSTENNKETLVFSKKVNTAVDKKIALDFISNYTSGNYKIVFTAKDAFDNNIETQSTFRLIQSKDKYDPSKIFTATQLNKNPKKDGFALVKLVSILPELYISTAGNYQNKLFFEDTFHLQNNEILIKIPVAKEFENSLKISFQSIFENSPFNEYLEIILEKEKEAKLEFSVESFRNKLQPGSAENWSFQLKSTNTKNEAEVLASMYDSSLDQFAKIEWNGLTINDDYYNNSNFKSSLGFDKTYTNLRNLNAPLYQIPIKNESNQLIWFGFNFNNINNYLLQYEYQKQLNKKAPKPANAVLISGFVTDSSGDKFPGAYIVIKGTARTITTDYNGYFEIEAAPNEVLVCSYLGYYTQETFIGNKKSINIILTEDSNSLNEVVVIGYGTQKKSNLVGAITSIKDKKIGAETIKGDPDAVTVIEEDNTVYNTAGIDVRLENTNKKDLEALNQVTTRKNLSETAFIFPHLKTDSKGKISFNFTSPEALTSWKLRLLAHNKNAVSGYLEKNVVTQKELMLVPNLPRFFREKDSITISAKIANMTNESKTGIAMLQFYDATTMQPIDSKMLNSKNIKNFSISAFGNTTATWKVYIPEGLQGVQYKIVAKAGNYSDGEENILPVLTNNILVTESRAIWVRENSTKTYTFENLKNNTSTTLKNHQFTLEYTSNPTWLAIQSLPYLMEYEHECAEQTFARFYSNELASKIISSNPKIAALFETWRKNGKLNSKLEENEALKSIILAETPWLKDAQSEDEKKKNLALLFDLEKMKNAQEATFTLLKQKQDASGGFAWFEGNYTNEYITRHILSGLGHLAKLNPSDETNDKIAEISKKGIPYLDNKFLKNHANRTKNLSPTEKLIWINPYSDLHYLYTRSFYLDKYPLTDTLKKATKIYLEIAKKDWLHYSLYEKGLAALTLNRFGEKEAARTILTSLKETASNNEDWGMYWIENKAGWYWYQAPIETQALLIEAFSEITNDNKSVDAMKVWLLKNKQSKNWHTTKATTEAIYALLLQGTDWLSVKDNTIIKVGEEKILTKKLSENEKEAETGYLKLNWKVDEIKKQMATTTIQNKSKVPGFGGIYWQYFEDLDKIKTDSTNVLSVSKELYLKKTDSKGVVLNKITAQNQLEIGNLVTVRLIITTKENMEFVHLKDLRASCFEPEDVLSTYDYKEGLGFYKSTKDAATHFFFDKINKGTYVLEYDIRVNNSGDFSNGITTIQSMYAPEFSSHTKGIRVQVK
jgi:uncharacterized protein YfaS (alpha-2-macroglobulin family)